MFAILYTLFGFIGHYIIWLPNLLTLSVTDRIVLGMRRARWVSVCIEYVVVPRERVLYNGSSERGTRILLALVL